MFEKGVGYAAMAVASGVVIAFGSHAWDSAQKRHAVLDALPPGYVYPGCDDVRAAGVAPLHSHERGFSEQLDGDGDGIGCEPYRGG